MDSYNANIQFIHNDFRPEVEAYHQLIASGENNLEFKDDMELMDVIQNKQAEHTEKEAQKQAGRRRKPEKLKAAMTLIQLDMKDQVHDEKLLQARYMSSKESMK